MHRSAAAVLALLAAPAALAVEAQKPGPDWDEANKTDEFVIFTREDAAAQSREVRAITEINAPPERVFQVIGDYEHYTEYVPYIRESKVLQKLGEQEFVTYQLLELPLISNRDYALHIRRTVGSPANGGVFKSEWDAAPDATPVRDGVVRVRLNKGYWLLEPADGGKRTRCTYSLLTAPGGSIPQWLGNRSNSIAVPDLLKAVRSRSLDPKWRRP